MNQKIFVAIVSGLDDDRASEAIRKFHEKEHSGIGILYNNRTLIFPAESLTDAREVVKDVIDASIVNNEEMYGVCLFEATEDLIRGTDMGTLYFAKVRQIAGETL